MNKIKQHFDCRFMHWAIELPIEELLPGKVYMIVKKGWTIWVRIDVDDEKSLEYLDYYAVHRMTNDRHTRVYADGDMEYLPVIKTFCINQQGATTEERRAAEKELFLYNQEVARQLDEKGFIMTSQAHGSAQLNRYLLTKPGAEP